MFIVWPRQRSKSAASATTPWEGLGSGDAAFVDLTFCFAPRPLAAGMRLNNHHHDVSTDADTYRVSLSPDAVLATSQWVALATISRAIAEHLIGYGNELHLRTAEPSRRHWRHAAS